jgi:microsomal dipeptidase-like Zn-dependent dipeptidase
VGLGTDLDGGFDAKHAAMGDTKEFATLRTKLRRSFSAEQVEGIMGANWLRFLKESLPA